MTPTGIIVRMIKKVNLSTVAQFMARHKRALIAGLILLLLGLLVAVVILFIQNRQLQSQATTASADDKQAAEVVTQLKKIIIIDSTDKPTVARIDDPKKLQSANKTFYKNVKTGDYLIVYPEKAYVYRPTERIIVNVANIVDGQQTARP